MVYGKSIGVSCTIQTYLTIIFGLSLQQLSKKFYSRYSENIIHKAEIKNIYSHLLIYTDYNQELVIINLEDYSKQELIEYPDRIQEVFKYSQLMMSTGRFFFGGGHDEFLVPSDYFIEFSISTKQFIYKKNLMSIKVNFSMRELDEHNILITGGLDENSSIQKCEIYDIKHNVWKSISNLNEERTEHNSFVFNQTSVYVIGGIKEKMYDEDRAYLHTIEKITFTNFKHDGQWEIVNVKPNQCNLSHPILYKLTESSILIVNHENYYYIYDVENNEINANEIKYDQDNKAYGYLGRAMFYKADIVNGTYYNNKYYYINEDINLVVLGEKEWDFDRLPYVEA